MSEDSTSSIPPGFRLRQILFGHYDMVGHLSWSPDGMILASNSDDNSIRLWNFNTGELLTTLRPHNNLWGDLAWSRDGRFLGATSLSEDAKILDVKENKLHFELKNLQTRELAYSPNGQFLASYNSYTVSIFNAQTFDLIKAFPLPYQKTKISNSAIKWSDNGAYLGIGSEGYEIYIYRADNWSLYRVINNPVYYNNDLLWMPDNNTLLVGSGGEYDRQAFVVGVWDIQNTRLITTLKGHPLPVRALKLSPDKTLLVSKSNDEIVRFWRCRDWSEVATLPGVPAGYADFHPHLPILALPYGEQMNEDYRIALWEVAF